MNGECHGCYLSFLYLGQHAEGHVPHGVSDVHTDLGFHDVYLLYRAENLALIEFPASLVDEVYPVTDIEPRTLNIGKEVNATIDKVFHGPESVDVIGVDYMADNLIG